MDATKGSSKETERSAVEAGATVTRITVAGARLDTAAGRALLRDTEAAFRAGARAVVIDLGPVGYMDSVGVSALAAVQRRAPAGARVVLAAMSPYVQTVARVTHLAAVFDVYATVEAATRALGG